MALLTATAGRRSALGALLVIGALLPAASPPAAAQERNVALGLTLQAACKERLAALRDAERTNADNIEWEVTGAGVRGRYTGYALDASCRLVDAEKETPTGQLNYQEVVYEKRGSSARAARAATPRPIEIRNVTLVMVYRDGQWE